MPESATDRPTKSHEYVFLLARSESYYYDAEAIRERDRGLDHPRSVLDGQPSLEPTGGLMPEHKGIRTTDGRNGSGRNKRTVWTIPTAPFPGAHFATFPPALVEPCVKAGTSERGACPACGAPWRREVERVSGGKSYATGKSADKRSAGLSTGFSGYDDGSSCPVFRTTGWSPTCTCPAAEPVPCVVLDPFAGAGTTGLVACGLGRDFIGIELNPEYAEMARRRLVNEAPGALLGGVAPRSLRADDASTLFGEVPEEGGRG